MAISCTRAIAQRHARNITTPAISASPARAYRTLSPSTLHCTIFTSRHPTNTFSTRIALQQQPNTPPTPSPLPSTTPPTSESASASQEQTHQKPNPNRKTRRRILFAGAFLFLGTTLGSIVRTALAPPDLPEPGSEGDIYLLTTLREKATHLDLHERLSSDPAWESWDAYEGFPKASDPSSTSNPSQEPTPHHHPRRITSDILSTSRAIAYQRIFHNPVTHEVISIVYFGSSVAGWPGVVHGGLLATLLDESLGRCAILLFPARTGVTANLELDYKKPTRTEGWYIIRTQPVPVMEDEDDEKQNTTPSAAYAGKGGGGWGSWIWGSKSSARTPGKEADTVKLTGKKSDRKRWITGSLERPDGTVCVKAKALFVVPKGAKVGPISPKF